MSDFSYAILEDTRHRPWPMPDRPWAMTQSWHDLLFAHWPADANQLRALVPAALPLDLFDGQAWVAIVPFHMTNVAPRGVPSLPWVSAFPELNVRTYVTVGGKPGVYFFSLDAASAAAVTAARMLFGLPYYLARMTVVPAGDEIDYESTRVVTSGDAAEFAATYRPIGPPAPPSPGTLEHFLTERYCLYTADGDTVRRVDIHHPPWPLQPAAARIRTNTMASAIGIDLPAREPLLHFAKRQDVVAWLPTTSR
jgi:uncharacterized protein